MSRSSIVPAFDRFVTATTGRNMTTAARIAAICGVVMMVLLTVDPAYAALHSGVDGVWWSTPIANVATAVVAALWFARGTWKTRRLISPIRKEQEAVEEQAQM